MTTTRASARGFARTVLGEVAAASLGRVDYHEHLFQATPLLPGDELDDERRSADEAGSLRASGFDAMIDATPTALGRRPRALQRISRDTGLAVVATTGAHREEHYPPGHWIRSLSEEELAARFAADVLLGLPERDSAEPQPATGVRAGVVKAGLGYWRISSWERRVLAAVAATHHRTGVPIMVHLEAGSAALEVLEVLVADGVPSDAVALAHADRNPDPGLHAEIAAAGAYLGYDGFARTRERPDSDLLTCLVTAAQAGARDRILVGGDVARSSRYRAYGGMPGLAYLGERIVPRLEAAGGPELLHAVLRTNPQQFLARLPSPDLSQSPVPPHPAQTRSTDE